MVCLAREQRLLFGLLTLLASLTRIAAQASNVDARSYPLPEHLASSVPSEVGLEATPRPQAAAVPVVPLPTSTVTYTTTPPLLRPIQVSPYLEPGLVGELFDFDSKTSTVAVIDHTVHHWGDIYSALAIKWTGLLFIRQPGVYRFQITCMGAAELRIDGAILIKEDTLLTHRTNIPSNPVTLPAGHHAILIGYTELQGQAGFAINYLGPDTQNQLKLIPAHALMHAKGPCDLRALVGADNVACGDKDHPRWALSSGESCQVRCSWGRYPMGLPGSSSFVSCRDGQLSRPDFKCSLVQCSSPKVANIGTPGCEEGNYVDDGAHCTPRCAHGFGPVVSEQPTCHNGTISGSFSCQAKRSCAAPSHARIANGGTPSCLNGPTIAHGARCGAFCAHGFEPVQDPICQDGVLVPEVFACRPLQRSTTRQQLGQAAPLWYETTKPPLVFLGNAGPPVSGLPATLLLSAIAAAVLSAGACMFMSLAKKKNKKRGLLIGDDSRRSISNHSGPSSEGSRSGSDSGSEADWSPVPAKQSKSHAQVEAWQPPPPVKKEQHSWRHEETREKKRRASEERQREYQQERRLQQPQQEQPQPPPKERILGSSYRSGPVPAPKRAPLSARRYAEDVAPHWGDVRLGDHNPAKANQVPWSDVRIG